MAERMDAEAARQLDELAGLLRHWMIHGKPRRAPKQQELADKAGEGTNGDRVDGVGHQLQALGARIVDGAVALRGWLERTRAFALELGCKGVGPVEQIGPDFIWGRRKLSPVPGDGDPKVRSWRSNPGAVT